MSSTTNGPRRAHGLRRAGVVGLSTLVATSMMTGLAVTASAVAGDYAAGSVLTVAQDPAPQTPQAAGALSLEFANSWTAGATQTFTVGSNDCSTPAGVAAAVGFAAAPTVVVTDPGVANVGGTMPVLTPGVLGSSSATCATAGITDKVTLTQSVASTGDATDTYQVDLSAITYNVGATTPKGNISVATAGSFKASGSVVNAVIPIAAFTNTFLVAALPSASGVSLGTQTFTETTPGAFFPGGATTVVLTPSVAALTGTPVVSAPTGYTVSGQNLTAGSFTFVVTAAPATPTAATVTVSGLTLTAPAAAQTVTLGANVGAVPVTPVVKVVNVVAFNARTGGATRYDTAAALFTSELNGGSVGDVVLSSGTNFPDALSANYLAGQVGTGILLTTPTTLSSAARTAIIRAGVDRVFITGGTGAVSSAVQKQIEATHIRNVAANGFIQVVRVGGKDRYETNLMINERFFTPTDTVLLASGRNFPDALALGPVAYQMAFPLILTAGTTLGTSENIQLAGIKPKNVVIAGGTGVVSQAIETSLKAKGFHVLRLQGVNRTLTAAAIAGWATDGIAGATAGSIEASQGFDSDTTYISAGSNFADALAAGPVAGINNRVIVLSSSPTVLGAGIPSYLGSKVLGTTRTTVATLHALGQTGAVSAALMKAAAVTIGQ